MDPLNDVVDGVLVYTLCFKKVHPSTTIDNFKSCRPIPVIFDRDITE